MTVKSGRRERRERESAREREGNLGSESKG